MIEKDYYQSRVNNAIKYINDNLTEEIRISQLAEAAHFSSFHFERIYKGLQTESPYETVLRLRLEKSIFLLKHQPDQPINQIAFDCGFRSVENFTRQFKSRFGFTASQFKKDKGLRESKIYQDHQNNKTDIARVPWDKEKSSKFEVLIEELDDINVVINQATFGSDGSALVSERMSN